MWWKCRRELSPIPVCLNQTLGTPYFPFSFSELPAIIVIRAGIWYTCGHLYNVVSRDAIGLAVRILVLVGVAVPMMCSAVCVPLRYVPSPGQPSTEGNANNTSPEYASRLPVLQERLSPRASSV